MTANRIVAVSVITLSAAAIAWPAAAWFGFGGGEPACAARDWRCLLDNAMKTAAVTENGTDGSSRGNQQLQIIASYPEAEQLAVIDQLLAQTTPATKDEEWYKEQIADGRATILSKQHYTAEAADTAISTGISLIEGLEVPAFVELALKATLERDEKDKVLELYAKHGDYIWRYAQGAALVLVEWLAENDPDELLTVGKKRWLPRYGWLRVSYYASQACFRGDIERGKKLQAVLQDQRDSWSPEQHGLAKDLANLIDVVAACDKPEAAEPLVSEVLDMLAKDLERVKTRTDYDADSKQLLTEGYTNDVINYGLTPLIYQYLDAGNKDAAVKTFGRMVFKEGGFNVDITADGMPAGQLTYTTDEVPWELVEDRWRRSRTIDLERPGLLDKAISAWEAETPNDKRSFARDRMKKFVAAIAGETGSKRDYVRRLNDLAGVIEADPEKIGTVKPLTTIDLASLEYRLAGCIPSDEQLLELQKQLKAETEYQSVQVEGETALARLLIQLEKPPAGAKDAAYGDCVIGAKA